MQTKNHACKLIILVWSTFLTQPCLADLSVSATHKVVQSNLGENGNYNVTLKLSLHNTGTMSLFNIVLKPLPADAIVDVNAIAKIEVASLAAGSDFDVDWKIKSKLSPKLILKNFFVFAVDAMNALKQSISFSLVSVAGSP